MTKEITISETSIRSSIERFTKAWNIHDAKAFSQVFAEDADFTNVFGQQFHGRMAIEAQHASIFTTMFRESAVAAEKISVRMLDHRLAAVDVVWTMNGAMDPKGNPWPARKGLTNLVMKNVDENWLILIMHNMDFPPAQAN